MNGVVVRHGRRRDWGPLRELLNESFPTELPLRRLHRELPGHYPHMLVAELDGAVVGVAWLRPSAQIRCLWLDFLCVSSVRRGVGVGRALMEAILREASAVGCLQIGLAVLKENRRAVGIYEAFGFSTVNETKGKFHMRADIIPQADWRWDRRSRVARLVDHALYAPHRMLGKVSAGALVVSGTLSGAGDVLLLAEECAVLTTTLGL